MKPESHPVWVRGLKHLENSDTEDFNLVAPRVGAWIETAKQRFLYGFNKCRTPCGCVD